MSRFEDRVAYYEDAQEDSGSSLGVIDGTRKYARSEHASPSKERPNTGKSRAEHKPSPRASDSSGNLSPTDSDSTTRSDKKAREKEARRQARKDMERDQRDRERRRQERHRIKAADDAEAKAAERQARAEAKAAKEAKPQKARPTSLRHSQTQPVVQHHTYARGHVEDPSSYGVRQPAASGPRPRAQTRPASYYAGQGSRPPITNMSWHQTQHPPGPFPPVGTYPPPMYGGVPPHPQAVPPPSPTRTQGYYDAHGPGGSSQNHLKQRFDMGRPSSAMGFQTAPTMSYPRDEYENDGAAQISRRPSRSKKQSEDRKKMPPPDFIPARAQSAAIPHTPFRPPPVPVQRPPSRHNNQSRAPPAHRRSVGFADQQGYDGDDFLGDHSLFHDMSPDPSPDQRRMALARARRKSSNHDQDYDIVPASSRGKRASMYGTGTLGTGGVSLGGDSKYLEAMRYQEEVGGSQVPLTAETLRKATKPRGGASSRSTRSSASRDESEFRRSNTTGITRSSSSNNDDVTIKLSGAALVRVQGAEIECDGGEITFSNRPAGSRSGSDQASTVYKLEDTRSRPERKALPHRARAPSQSDSQSRGYAPSYAPYDPALAAENYI